MNKLRFLNNRVNPFYKQQVAKYSSKKHNTNFDYHLDWLLNKVFTNNLTVTKGFLFLNFAFFGYNWLRPTESGRYKAQDNTSFSIHNLERKDYVNLFASLLGSRRIDDLIFDSAVLVTIGAKLEKTHGTPFVFKLCLFSLYLGFLSQCFWVRSDLAKNDRYKLTDPKSRIENQEKRLYKFQSQHAISMSLLYFYLFKYRRMLVLPVLLVDLYFWGPMYGNAALSGLAMGIIL